MEKKTEGGRKGGRKEEGRKEEGSKEARKMEESKKGKEKDHALWVQNLQWLCGFRPIACSSCAYVVIGTSSNLRCLAGRFCQAACSVFLT